MAIGKKNKDFDIIVGQLSDAYRALLLTKYINSVDFADLNIKLWLDIRHALIVKYLLTTAKIFDKYEEKDNKKTLSIYYLLDINFVDHIETIEGLRKFRNKVLVHNDLTTLRNLEKFTKDLKIGPKEVKALLEKTFNVLDDLKKHYDLGSFGHHNPKDIDEDLKKDLGNLRNIFKAYTTERRRVYLEKHKERPLAVVKSIYES